MKFVDELEIVVKGGNGGPGCVSFHREKYQPMGGPDGGDGGRGGDIYIRANPQLQSLSHLLKKKVHRAENGEPGRRKRCSGRDGEKKIIMLPVGTEITESESGRIILDLTHPTAELLIAKGGSGGKGNQHFATAARQSPEYAQPGLPGEEKRIKFELKLIADVGLIGLPNAGKSTLLKALTANQPKIADYPFTTLTPNIGILENESFRRILLADIPGIIKGASEGSGLGLSFLRHIERVQVIIFILDIAGMTPAEDIVLLQRELAAYSEKLLQRPSLLVINKIDLVDYDEDYIKDMISNLKKEDSMTDRSTKDLALICISALEGKGIGILTRTLFDFFPEKTFAERLLDRSNEKMHS